MHIESLWHEILTYFWDFNFLSFWWTFFLETIFSRISIFKIIMQCSFTIPTRFIITTLHAYTSVACSTSPPSGNQVDGLPLAISENCIRSDPNTCLKFKFHPAAPPEVNFWCSKIGKSTFSWNPFFWKIYEKQIQNSKTNNSLCVTKHFLLVPMCISSAVCKTRASGVK